MRIIGSSRIDDYKKATLDDSVLKALDVKPGDSVLFYKKQGDSNVCIYRAEGARVSDESDTPRRNHARGAVGKLRTMLLVSVVLMLGALGLMALKSSEVGMTFFLVAVAVWAVAMGALLGAILYSRTIDRPYDPETLVTVGGPFSKNRLAGLSRLTSDGYIVTGELYINSLFGANPGTVEVDIRFDDGRSVKAVTNRQKAVPGYSVYKLRFKESEITDGKVFVTTTYVYDGKSIVIGSEYDLGLGPGGKEIVLTEGPVTAGLEFDENLNSVAFDESLFDPVKDTEAI
ncbi:MAG: hypothetical protein GX224_03580 [Thermoplasmatales archaeon]|nr:hypothetical protein [Thermoplasmatales archaeon]